MYGPAKDEAFVFHFKNAESNEVVVLFKRDIHFHHHAKRKTSNIDASAYFKSIEATLANACEIVISGPSSTKFEFAKHLGEHHKGLSERIIAIEKVDQANDGDILSIARKYFKVPTAIVHSSYIAGL